MIASIQRLVGKAARALSRQTKDAVLIGAYQTLPTGERGLAWAADEITAQDAEMLAVGLLQRLATEAGEHAIHCEGCAERCARALTALSALGLSADGPLELRPEHVH